MGRDFVTGGAGLAIALISPFEIWCAGIEQLARMRGWRFKGSLPRCPEGVEPGTISQVAFGADVLLVANRLLARPGGTGRQRPLPPRARGGMVVVIEPDDPFTMDDFLSLEVEGMVLSTASFDELGHCIESVGGGGRWVDPGIRQLLGAEQREAAAHPLLTERELQVARLAAIGLSNKEIARELGVSDGTVKMHMHHVLGKLNVESRFNLSSLQWLLNSKTNGNKRSPNGLNHKSEILPTFF